MAGQQEITRRWWSYQENRYRLFVSELVIEEAMKGDADAAQKRTEAIAGLPLLEVDDDIVFLTNALLESGIIPSKAAVDAAHIAVGCRYAIDYLLTWNCKHIANAEIIRGLSFVVSEAGYNLPVICTPLELMGGYDDD
ncbi:MAG TPA: DNA-binding protein [Candidatus Hydrogenedentes bacterium]|nr:DNA-binding protein [Candidatus Hydrogenedentota bacterium]